VKQTDKKRGK